MQMRVGICHARAWVHLFGRWETSCVVWAVQKLCCETVHTDYWYCQKLLKWLSNSDRKPEHFVDVTGAALVKLRKSYDIEVYDALPGIHFPPQLSANVLTLCGSLSDVGPNTLMRPHVLSFLVVGRFGCRLRNCRILQTPPPSNCRNLVV